MRTLRFIIAQYRLNPRWLALGGLSLMLGTLCQVAVPVMIKLAVDAADPNLSATPQSESVIGQIALGLVPFSFAADMDFVIRVLGIALAIVAIGGVFLFGKRYYLIRISRRTEYLLKRRMYEHLQDQPAEFFNTTRSGGIMSLMTSDIEAVRMMIGPAIMHMGSFVFVFPASLAVMFTINARLTWLALIPLIGLTLATIWFNPRVRRYSTRSQEELEELSARAQENFAGARVVKAFSREQFEVAELDRLSENYLRSKLGVARNQAAFQASIWGFSGLGLLIIVYFGATEIAKGAFSAGDFAAFILYNVQLYWPMIALGWVSMLFVRASASLKRIDKLLDRPSDTAQLPGGIKPASLRGEIEFEAVSLRYAPDLPPALSGVDFRVEPGKTIAIVGQVGCGKSTVANLLLRLIEPTEGRILIDGLPIKDYDPHALRSFIGYVPQDSFLFSESIADNIGLALGPETPDRDERIAGATRAAEFETEVMQLPDGYDTLLGERGVNLSGGQKQRAAIARALAARPTILVLDDCLSSVDTETEERILANLKAQTREITTLIIAQRISTVAHADEILVLERGRIIERGTDRELRQREGLYADLVRRQELAEELA